MLTAGQLQVFGKGLRAAQKGTAGAQRPEQAEQQSRQFVPKQSALSAFQAQATMGPKKPTPKTITKKEYQEYPEAVLK